MIQKFGRKKRGFELVPDLLHASVQYILQIVYLLEQIGQLSPDGLDDPFVRRSYLALVIDLVIPLLPYMQLQQIITETNLMERILDLIYRQTRRPFFYGMGVDLVEAAVASGYASTLITER